MKAIGYQQSLEISNPDSLQDIELPRPEASGRDLLVAVKAISVNPVDTKVRMRAAPEAGEYKVLGWDAVGEVIEVGSAVENYQVGDQVFYAGDLTRPGTNSEFHLVDELIAGKRPASLSDVEAAALPLTTITAWELLFDRLGFVATVDASSCENTRLLVIGAAGGVGSILVQLAKQLTGATVIGTASRDESQKWVKDLGADHVINHRNPLTQELKAIGIESVTHVVSLTHTDDHYDEIVEALAPQGELALIDDPQKPIDILKLKQKSISLHWEFMYTRSMFQTEDMGKQGELLNRVSELIDQGKLKTTLGANYGTINAENLRRAHADIETGTAIGKVVLEGFE